VLLVGFLAASKRSKRSKKSMAERKRPASASPPAKRVHAEHDQQPAAAAAATAAAADVDAGEEEEDTVGAPEMAAEEAQQWRDAKLELSQHCPYLDTINRVVLDFDFEKLCSVSMSTHNIYACLVCGKYFQGAGAGVCVKPSPLLTHSSHAHMACRSGCQDACPHAQPDGRPPRVPEPADAAVLLPPGQL
jgi:hypothetical protein